ncbi:hypothetical protein ACJ72_07281 [Emergomyces africanus]|uniref:Uncharacterized protein n=1 Tax=Emergomyces africanus TaxID=1955775 RepID=A0A1B7NNN0_9EURO|nr:hypothetical protein ACJ72_07281 [Emergomyces africanus]
MADLPSAVQKVYRFEVNLLLEIQERQCLVLSKEPDIYLLRVRPPSKVRMWSVPFPTTVSPYVTQVILSGAPYDRQILKAGLGFGHQSDVYHHSRIADDADPIDIAVYRNVLCPAGMDCLRAENFPLDARMSAGWVVMEIMADTQGL